MNRTRFLRQLGLCAAGFALAAVLTGCGGPNASYLKKELAQSSSFFALFDSHVGDDLEKYELSEVTVKQSEKDSSGGVNLTADITCVSDQASYTGEFDFMLDHENNSWSILKQTLVQGTYHDVAAPTQEDILANWDTFQNFSTVTPMGASAEISNIQQDTEGGVTASADAEIEAKTTVFRLDFPCSLTLTYTGEWEITNETDVDTDNMILTLTVPMGTYLAEVRGDYVAMTLYQQNAGTPGVEPDYQYLVYGYDDYDRTLQTFDSGTPDIDANGDYVSLSGLQITLDAQGKPTTKNENVTLSYVSAQITEEAAIDAVVGAYKAAGRTVSASTINDYVLSHGLDPDKLSNYPSGYTARLDMSKLLSATIFDCTFLEAVHNDWPEDWLGLYVWGSSDPDETATPAVGDVPPMRWYDKSISQWTLYGIPYQDAAAAGWGDAWKNMMGVR